jgi:hypothetical protein
MAGSDDRAGREWHSSSATRACSSAFCLQPGTTGRGRVTQLDREGWLASVSLGFSTLGCSGGGQGLRQCRRRCWPRSAVPSARGPRPVRSGRLRAAGRRCPSPWALTARSVVPIRPTVQYGSAADQRAKPRRHGQGHAVAMTAVLIYTRLSTEDVHDAAGRQEVACRSYAEARNWEVAAALCDVDASAYQPRARRPGFETLIAEAAARSADGVLGSRSSRSHAWT